MAEGAVFDKCDQAVVVDAVGGGLGEDAAACGLDGIGLGGDPIGGRCAVDFAELVGCAAEEGVIVHQHHFFTCFGAGAGGGEAGRAAADDERVAVVVQFDRRCSRRGGRG